MFGLGIRLGIHNAILPGGGISTAFHAATEDGDEFVQELIGVGGETYVHTADILRKDHEGVYRTFGENQQVVEGGRVVENEALYSNDFTELNGGSTGGNTATENTVEFTAAVGYRYKRLNARVRGGKTYLLSARLSSSDKDKVGFRIAIGGGNESNFIQIDLTPTPTVYVVGVTAAIGLGSLTIDVGLENRALFGGDGSTVGTVTATDFQVENAAGRSDVVTPSEYIPTTTAQIQKVFSTTNGNSVTDNVVTEGVGDPTPLLPLPMQVYQGAATNMQLWNSDLTSRAVVTGTPVVTLDQTGPVNAKGNAWQVEDNETGAAAVIGYRFAGAATDFTGPVTMIADIVKDAESTVECYWNYQLETGNVCRSGLTLNTSTGSIASSSPVGAVTLDVEDRGDYWRVFAQLDADGTQGNVLNRFYPAGLTASNVRSVGVIYDAIFKDKTIAEVKDLGPIFTEGTAVTTDETIITHAAANHDNAEGAYTGTIDYAGDDTPVLSLGGVPFLYIEDAPVSGKQLTLDDGTSQVSLPITVGKHDFEAHYNAAAGEMQLTLDAATSAVTVYDGTLGTGDITVGETGRDFKRFDTSEIV